MGQARGGVSANHTAKRDSLLTARIDSAVLLDIRGKQSLDVLLELLHSLLRTLDNNYHDCTHNTLLSYSITRNYRCRKQIKTYVLAEIKSLGPPTLFFFALHISPK